MDENKNSVVKLFLSYVSNVSLTKVTKHLCLLNLNIFLQQNSQPKLAYSLLGNFADIIYQNKDSFLHRTGDVCTL